MNQPVLAGKDDALPAFLLCLFLKGFYEPSGAAFPPERRNGIQAENHLPGPFLVVEGCFFIHFIPKILSSVTIPSINPASFPSR